MPADNVRESVEKFVRGMLGATQAMAIYGKSHALTSEAVNSLYADLAGALASLEQVTIGIIGGEIVFEKRPFYAPSENMADLISRLKEMGAEKVNFRRGVSLKELRDFVDICAMNPRAVASSGGIAKALSLSCIKNITLEKIGFRKPEERKEEEEAFAAAKKDFQEGVDFVKKTLDDLAGDRRIDASTARLFVDKIVQNLLKNKYPLLILTSLKHHDEYTFVHAVNVAILTLAQAEALALDEGLLGDIGLAGLLHDAGKLALAADILRKKEKLDAEEFEKVRLHPADGARMLLEMPDIPPLAAISAFEHHMKYDMSGYPGRVYGKKINLASMMVAISDTYDAMRASRSYHEGMAPEKAYEEMMKLSGTQLHPDLVENFFRTLGAYPPGTLVELDTGEIAFVARSNALDVKRPLVEVLYGAGGARMAEPLEADLSERAAGTGSYKRSIIRSIAFSDKYDLPAKYKV